MWILGLSLGRAVLCLNNLRTRNKYFTFFFFRSDVLGQILPVVGQAWAQSGVVRVLFHCCCCCYYCSIIPLTHSNI